LLELVWRLEELMLSQMSMSLARLLVITDGSAQSRHEANGAYSTPPNIIPNLEVGTITKPPANHKNVMSSSAEVKFI
jgi:hypothetical protein